jgi:DNA-binding winged helix-turn-helix (wHTH) protein
MAVNTCVQVTAMMRCSRPAVEIACVRVSFDDFEFDTDQFTLAQFGRAIAMEPQVFDVPAFLISHRDRIVSKEELLDSVWGDRFVSESALTSRIKAMRQALGDDGSSQRFVQTVRGRGYRFIASATEFDDQAKMRVPTSLKCSCLGQASPESGPRRESSSTLTVSEPFGWHHLKLKVTTAQRCNSSSSVRRWSILRSWWTTTTGPSWPNSVAADLMRPLSIDRAVAVFVWLIDEDEPRIDGGTAVVGADETVFAAAHAQHARLPFTFGTG